MADICSPEFARDARGDVLGLGEEPQPAGIVDREAVAIVLFLSVSTLLWGPEASIRRITALTFVALGVTTLTWMVIGTVVGQPSDTDNEALGLLLMMTGASVVLQGKRTVAA